MVDLNSSYLFFGILGSLGGLVAIVLGLIQFRYQKKRDKSEDKGKAAKDIILAKDLVDKALTDLANRLTILETQMKIIMDSWLRLSQVNHSPHTPELDELQKELQTIGLEKMPDDHIIQLKHELGKQFKENIGTVQAFTALNQITGIDLKLVAIGKTNLIGK